MLAGRERGRTIPLTDIPRFGEECQSLITCAGLEVGTEAGGPKPLSLALRRSTSQTAQRIFFGVAVGSTAPRSSSDWRDGFCVALAATRENRGKLMVTDFVTYLSFDGRCEEAFKRYEKVFKGKIAT